jgi:uncharacterized protein
MPSDIMIAVRGTSFEWDDGNREKCLKHGVSIDEIEAVFGSDPAIYPDLLHSEIEERWQAIGRSPENRWIFVAFTVREGSEQSLLRPLSARYMHDKEIRHYDESR